MRWLMFMLLLLPGVVQGQGAATLAADSVTLSGGNQLVASGNVEVLYAGTRLTASQITFDQSRDQLTISGPIVITQADGTILTADSASLDPQLQSGMLRSARLVLDQQLQLAANQIDRAEGRYSQLYKTAVTSCQVCANAAPLWDIRAERIVHDAEARQLYFTNATFHVRGLPIFWLPRMRLPDPTLDRASGFLIPRIRTTDQLSTGIKLPYFLTLGDHRDLTITPYVSSQTKTVELRYRQAFLRGAIEANAAFSNDSLQSGDRSYFFAEGYFDLGAGFQLAFDVEAASDPAYLLDYGYSEKDRLDSAISLTRVRQDDLLFASFTYYDSLRDDERDATLPPVVADFAYTRRFDFAGGALDIDVSADTIQRYGSDVGNDGRDVSRAGIGVAWQRGWTTDTGVLAQAQAGVRADWFSLTDAPAFDDQITRTMPYAGLTLRYPLAKRTATARHLLEPAMALQWSDARGPMSPNEDSTRPEFDEANMLDLTRFPGEDAVEDGPRGALGLHWTRRGVAGNTTRLTFGRVFRKTANADFTATSGLQGLESDWLIAGQYQMGEDLHLMGRTLLADTLDPTLASLQIDWQREALDLGLGYLWRESDAQLGRNEATSEISLESRTQLSPAWALSLEGRYDLANRAPDSAELGVEWRNECVTVDLSVGRRYTSSTTVDPSTDYGLSIALNGFSAGRSGGGPMASCKP